LKIVEPQVMWLAKNHAKVSQPDSAASGRAGKIAGFAGELIVDLPRL
jgi:hypothetical protein